MPHDKLGEEVAAAVVLREDATASEAELRNFLALSYDELEELNLKGKEQRKNRVAMHKIQEERLKYLTDEKRIKAVTVLFSDLACAAGLQDR